MTKDTTTLNKTISPGSDDPLASTLFYPVIYFVENGFEETHVACGGKTVGEPSGIHSNGCGASCENALLTGCVGYNVLVGGEAKALCFLFSELTNAKY